LRGDGAGKNQERETTLGWLVPLSVLTITNAEDKYSQGEEIDFMWQVTLLVMILILLLLLAYLFTNGSITRNFDSHLDILRNHHWHLGSDEEKKSHDFSIEDDEESEKNSNAFRGEFESKLEDHDESLPISKDILEVWKKESTQLLEKVYTICAWMRKKHEHQKTRLDMRMPSGIFLVSICGKANETEFSL